MKSLLREKQLQSVRRQERYVAATKEALLVEEGNVSAHAHFVLGCLANGGSRRRRLFVVDAEGQMHLICQPPLQRDSGGRELDGSCVRQGGLHPLRTNGARGSWTVHEG